MKCDGDILRLSATDLAGHLACTHLTQLDRLAAEGRLTPLFWRDPMLEILEERGRANEAAYVECLRESGLEIVRLDTEAQGEASRRTVAAMRAGAPVIVQATLSDGRWFGRADVLLRVEESSDLGTWSYQVVDAKLATETRGGTVLQLCLYSDLVAKVQGRMPEFMFVVSPGRHADPERFRTEDYLAYYRWVRSRLERNVDLAAEIPETYPEPVPHCDVCRWWPHCDRRRRDDDHLSLVAGATRLQRRELSGRAIDTLEKLARATFPLDPRPSRGSMDAYSRVHEQAQLQLASRGQAAPLFNAVQPIELGMGLARLPIPSAGDVFLDLEGDPFVDGGGREYLFGWLTFDDDGKPCYQCRWGLDAQSERQAFEAFVDEVIVRWERFPDLHVYHFAPYEPAALKRLMGRHGTREGETDRLLRGERFVDLHGVIRQGIRVGVERYTLKDLEPVHAFKRSLDLREASAHLRSVERVLELGVAGAIPASTRTAVEAYNRDDCFSTWSLRNWLEAQRSALVEYEVVVPRPEPGMGAVSEKLDERQQRILALFDRLTRDTPVDPSERDAEQQARWLLANLLDWHRREDKSTWWEFFRLRALSTQDLLAEKAALSGLEFVSRFGGTDACPVHRYRFPEQDHEVRAGHNLFTTEGVDFGEITAIDAAHRTMDVKKRKATKDLHPPAAFVHDYVNPRPLPDSIEWLAGWVADHGLNAAGGSRAARDLLLRIPPRLVTSPGPALRHGGEDLIVAARRLVLDLDHGVLPLQGPPGAGKTYVGARMICALVRAGKRIGITAVSHKVIRNLIDAVLKAATEEGMVVRCALKVREPSETAQASVLEVENNPDLLNALVSGEAQVAGATVWSWARPEFREVLDVLVVDEAGQMSLANTLAVAPSARNLVLLGDPQQLEQPIKGSHPEGSEASSLEHLLQEHQTMPDDRGLFIPDTRRLHPTICRFTSEIFYEGRLSAHDSCEQQRLVGDTPFAGAGLWFVAVEHEGNQSSAPEEVERIGAIVDELLSKELSWIDAEGRSSPLTQKDILIVAPYNAQVGLLSRRLPGARIGTVDKFQGQEAPVVIYSMTTTSPEDAPRGMEFLYSLHRFNVATSRARCVCIVVASPRLLEPSCQTPHQIRLANALCRFVELSQQG